MNYIGVIDCNNFFVSCERLFRPDLVGKPVMVLSSNDGCVVARSQEVKDIGVTMGVPIFQIKDIIKDNGIVTFSSHFALYRDISSRVFKVVKTMLPVMEIYSIDEAFFSIESDNKKDLEHDLKWIKKEVERLVGIPVSLGVAATKTQAKYANRLAKKAGGVVVLDDEDWVKLAPLIALQNIWGVGGKLELRYKAAGISTVADLLACTKTRVSSLFGICGLRLQSELAGTVVHSVSSKYSTKQSIMSSRSFEKKVLDKAVVKDAVAYHVRQVVAELRHLNLKTSQIAVTLGTSRHGDYLLRGGTLKVENLDPTDDVVLLLRETMALVDKFYEPDVPYKKAGVYIAGFSAKAITQQSLFAETQTAVINPISKILDEFNVKYGNDFVTVGQQTKGRLWQSKSEQKSPAYTTQWSEIAIAKTN